MWYLLHSDEETFEIIEKMMNKPSWTLILKFKKQANQKKEVNKQIYDQWIELMKMNESSEFQKKIRECMKHLAFENMAKIFPPLHVACNVGDKELVKIILDKIKDPFMKNDYPFQWAKYQPEVMKMLMDAYFSKGSWERTPLEIAIANKNAENISLLLPLAGPNVVRNLATIPINMDKIYRIATAALLHFQPLDFDEGMNFEMEITNVCLRFIIRSKVGKEHFDITELQCINNTECLGFFDVCTEKGCICL